MISPEQQASLQNINGHSSQVCKDWYLRQDIRKDVLLGRKAFKHLVKVSAPAALTEEPADTDTVQQESEPEPEPDAEPLGQPPLLPPRHPSPFTHPHPHPHPFWQSPTRSTGHAAPWVYAASPHPAMLAYPHVLSPPMSMWTPPRTPPMPPVLDTSLPPWGSAHPNGPTLDARRARWSEAEIAYVANWYQTCSLPNDAQLAKHCLKHIKQDPYARPIFHGLHVVDSARLRTGLMKYISNSSRELIEQRDTLN